MLLYDASFMIRYPGFHMYTSAFSSLSTETFESDKSAKQARKELDA
jgi:hypothetical protein